jgi:hypothetical protein
MGEILLKAGVNAPDLVSGEMANRSFISDYFPTQRRECGGGLELS